MKKFLITFVIFLFIGSVPSVSAQTSCSPVTSATYSSCCGTTAAASVNAMECKAYQGGYNQQTTQPDPQTSNTSTTGMECSYIGSYNYDYCCKTVGGAATNQTQCTAYDNGYGVHNTIGSGTQPSTTFNFPPKKPIYSSSQSSASELASCSEIKFKSLFDILIWVKCIILTAVIPLIYALAFVVFLWGVFKFIGTSDSVKREEGKKFIIAGLIGLFVMTSLWGIINILSTTLGTGSAVPLLQTK